MLGVQKPALETLLEHVVDRLPVAAGRLHPDQRHPVTIQPIDERQELARRGREGTGFLQPLPVLTGDAHSRGDRVLVHVEAGAALDEAIHRSSFAIDGEDAARRSLVTKNLGFALVAALSGAWKLPRHTFPRARSTNATPTSTKRLLHFHRSRVARSARITFPHFATHRGPLGG